MRVAFEGDGASLLPGALCLGDLDAAPAKAGALVKLLPPLVYARPVRVAEAVWRGDGQRLPSRRPAQWVKRGRALVS